MQHYKIIFSQHCKDRTKERNIDNKILLKAIQFPDKIDFSNKDNKRFVVKKIYHNTTLNKDHLLMIICQKENNSLKIITIIDTSKISKYY